MSRTTGVAQSDRYAERMQAARQIAQNIVALCEMYEHAPSQATMNRFIANVERLADLAEDLEVEQTVRALDG